MTARLDRTLSRRVERQEDRLRRRRGAWMSACGSGSRAYAELAWREVVAAEAALIQAGRAAERGGR